MADSHVDPKGHVNCNKNYITKKLLYEKKNINYTFFVIQMLLGVREKMKEN